MGKKSKKAAPVEAAPLSKKERKALAAREAELAAELAERKAAKKASKKKGDKTRKPAFETPPIPDTTAQAIADAKAARKAQREAAVAQGGETLVAQIDAHYDVLTDEHYDALTDERAAEVALDVAEGNSTPEAVASADAALDRVDTAKLDAEIKARVEARRRLREMQANGDAHAAEIREMAKAAPAAADDEGVLNTRKPKNSVEAFDAVVEALAEDAAAAQTAEVVETETGREFAVGTNIGSTVPAFGKPSEAPQTLESNLNGNGQYKIFTPDGKERGYTRVTTYIDTLEDKTALTAWKARVLLEGVAAAEEGGDMAVTAKVRDLVHNRDIAIAKARKADRKGKLVVGQLATMTDGAWSDFKRWLNALADDVFELGGGREKAAKGTDIHDLCAFAIAHGIDAVGEKLTAGEITPADLADVEAFVGALEKLGAKVVEIERVVVDDENRIAGRLDYVLMLKLPGMQRASRVVADLKTGRVDLGTGKIAQQIEKYSSMIGYDYDTHEREDLKLNRTKGLLIHLPAGSGKATVHIVDLGAGRAGNKLAGEVRAWRNEGKRSIDLKTDILTAS